MEVTLTSSPEIQGDDGDHDQEFRPVLAADKGVEHSGQDGQEKIGAGVDDAEAHHLLQIPFHP